MQLASWLAEGVSNSSSRQSKLGRCWAGILTLGLWQAACAGLLGLGQPLQAAETPGPAYTVIVGINQYADASILPRAFAEADAVALYQWLTSEHGGQVPAERVRLLLGRPQGHPRALPAHRDEILKAWHWALDNAKEEEVVLLAWFGQGAPVGDRTCYFAADSTLKDRGKNAISATQLEQLLEQCKSNRIVAILDVNFRGYDDKKEKISTLGLEKRLQEFDRLSDEEQERHADQRQMPAWVLSANDGMDPSPEDKQAGHGLLLQVVLDGLNGPADTETGEADGIITVGELFQYVRKEFPPRAKRDTGKAVAPLAFYSETRSHFALTINPKTFDTVRGRIAEFEKRAKVAGLPNEVVEEGRRLLMQVPRFEQPRQMRKHYLAFAAGQLDAPGLLQQRQRYLQALQVSRKEAELFADRVLRVADIARQNYVKPLTYADLIPAAVRGLYRYIDEKVPPTLEKRLEEVGELSREQLRQLLVEVRTSIGQRDDLQGAKASYRACEAMLHSLDNYSAFIDPDTVAEIERQTQQVFIGVGVQIQKDLATDTVRVVTPLRGSPAYRAGIQKDDLIVGVTNFVDKEGNHLPKPEYTDTRGMSIREVVNKILGKEGTEVQLHVERELADGTKKQLQFRLKRSRIEVETVFGVRRKPDDSWDFYIDPQHKIGYIRLSQFARFTARDLQRALEELRQNGLNGLILDLRFNPGGYLDAAVKIADLFVDDGLIVTVRPRRGQPVPFTGHHDGSYLDFPLVVLINGGSASASEIVSACIQDHDRGIIMGERSFGKGSVQNIIELQFDRNEGPSEVKLTTATFWRPSGKNLARDRKSKEEDDWGVRPHPDYTLKLEPGERAQLFAHLRQGEVIPPRELVKSEPQEPFTDRQLQMAVDFLKRQIAGQQKNGKSG